MTLVCNYLTHLLFILSRLTVHSRMWDACLVVDGGSSFAFNDAAEATLEIHEEDALRTITLD